MSASPLLPLYYRLSKLSDLIGRGIAWLVLLEMLLTFVVVVMRYGFDIGSIALQESVLYLHAALFMLAAGYTLQHNGHVRVDIFYRNFGPRGKALVDLLGTLLLLLPVTLFIGWSSLDYVQQSWAIMETSPEAGGLDYVYLLKSLIPLMVLVLLLQGVIEIIRNLLILAGQQLAPVEDAEEGV